jgi:transcriptional regulator with XRE-family HTH domain
MGADFLTKLGTALRAERKKAGLTQAAVGQALGLKPPGGHGYVSCLETGKMGNVGIETVIRYLQACKAPIGRFMLELAQSGAFGEMEQGLTVVEGKAKDEEAKRAKAKLLYEKRWEREFRDAQAIEALWKEVMPVIKPMLPTDRYYSLVPYLEGVREFYRVWKLVMRKARGSDPTQMLKIVFDRTEQKGLELRLIPTIVRKVREMVQARLCAGAG